MATITFCKPGCACPDCIEAQVAEALDVGPEREPVEITDATGYIVDKAVREAYDRIVEANRGSFDGGHAADTFLRLCERYAAKGIRLLPDLGR